MSIADNIQRIRTELGEGVTLVAVSKYSDDEAVNEAYAAGHRDFGENKAQDLDARAASMPDDIRWHFIGHLQRNKVKYIAPYIHLVHSIDSLRLLKEVNKQAAKVPRTIDCLLQLHIASEETKFGLSGDEALALLQSPELAKLPHIRLVGLMGMATNTDDMERVRSEFAGLKAFYDRVAQGQVPGLPPQVEFSVLSMGMSADYPVAIEEGSTMVRIGSAVFSAD